MLDIVVGFGALGRNARNGRSAIPERKAPSVAQRFPNVAHCRQHHFSIVPHMWPIGYADLTR